MDQDLLVVGAAKLAEELEKRVGPLALFMLLAPDTETDDAWHLIVSAPGFDARPRTKAIGEIIDLLRSDLPKAAWERVLRVTVLRTSEPFVRGMNTTFNAEHSVRHLNSVNIAGVEIPRAVLFESRKVAA